MFVCQLGLEGIVPKNFDAPYKSGPSKAWLKNQKSESPRRYSAIDGTFWHISARGLEF
jgi:ATP-dependent DNA ligase